jgi:hypothetical protein
VNGGCTDTWKAYPEPFNTNVLDVVHMTLSKLFALEIHLHPFIVSSMTCLSQNLMIMQIDTRDILFICGGAFVDLEKTISERYCWFDVEHSPEIMYLNFY